MRLKTGGQHIKKRRLNSPEDYITLSGKALVVQGFRERPERPLPSKYLPPSKG